MRLPGLFQRRGGANAGGTAGEDDGGNGAQERRVELLKKLRNATKGTVRVLNTGLHDHLQIPSKRLGALFIVESLLLIIFVVCLTVLALNERAPETLREASRSIELWAEETGVNSISTRGGMIELILSLNDRLSIVTQNAIVVNDLKVGSLRRSRQRCDTPPGIPSILGDYCLGNFQASRFDTDPFVTQNFTFWPYHEPTLCFGIVCAEGATTRLGEQTATFPPPIYRVAISRGDAFLPSQDPSREPPQRVGIVEQFPDDPKAQRSAMRDLLSQFIDPETRIVMVEIALLQPFYMMFTNLLIIFELPVTGGVFPNLDTRSVLIGEDLTKVRFTDGFCLAYSTLYLTLLVAKVVYTFGSRTKCVACSIDRSVTMFNCVKCQTPNELTLQVSACLACGKPVPSLVHRCWRRLIDIWNLWLLVNFIACIVWRYAMDQTLPYLRDRVAEELATSRAGQASFAYFLQAMNLTRAASNVVTLCIVLTYIRVFTLVCRGETSSRFFRIFVFGLPDLLPFVITTLFTFIGFAVAMHITIGYTVDLYTNMSSALLQNFRILTLNGEWTADPDAFRRTSATLLVIAFIVVCVFLMMNLFPSVLSVAYKKSLATPHYDTQTLSLWLMVKPVLQKIGLVRTRRVGRRRAKHLTNTLERSLHDDNEAAEMMREDSSGQYSAEDGENAENTAELRSQVLGPSDSESSFGDDASSITGSELMDLPAGNDLAELNDMHVAFMSQGRDAKTQIELRHLESLAEKTYLDSLSLEDALHTATDDVARLRKDLDGLGQVFPMLVLAARMASASSGFAAARQTSSRADFAREDETASADSGLEGIDREALDAVRRRMSTVLLGSSSSATPPPRGAGSTGTGSAVSITQPSSSRSGHPSRRPARGTASAAGGVQHQHRSAAPAPTQAVADCDWRHVSSDDDDHLVDEDDDAFDRAFREAYPKGFAGPTGAAAGIAGPQTPSYPPTRRQDSTAHSRQQPEPMPFDPQQPPPPPPPPARTRSGRRATFALPDDV